MTANCRAASPVAAAGAEARVPVVVEPAPAKVNLWLHVLGRRADGYHLLDSLAVFADVGERVAAWPDSAPAPGAAVAVSVSGPFAPALAAAGGEALAARAAVLLAEAAGIEPALRLSVEKRIPVAAGLGGGSADAAAALRALARLWRLGWDERRLATLAARLGADVPACLAARPLRMGGAGEVLAPAPPLPPAGLVLLHPGVACPTPAVFAARSGPFSVPAEPPAAGFADAAALATWLAAATRNDLEPAALSLVPAVAAALVALRADPASLLARMSGSGAACFALAVDAGAAAAAAARLAAAHPGWWAWGGALASGPHQELSRSAPAGA